MKKYFIVKINEPLNISLENTKYIIFPEGAAVYLAPVR